MSTNNMDLVPQEVLDELKALDAQLDVTKKSFESLLEPVMAISKELAKSTTSYKTLTELVKKLKEAEEHADDAFNDHKKTLTEIQRLQKKLISLESEEAKQIAQLREQIRQKNSETKTHIKLSHANANSIEALRQRVILLKKEWSKTDMGSEKFKQLSKEIAAANKKLSEQEGSIGVHSRNVGNYPLAGLAGMTKMVGGIVAAGAVVAELTGKVMDGMKTISEFEQANANLASILGKTQAEISGMTASAEHLGATTEWTATEVTKLQTELAKLGFNEGEISNMQESILQFATATGADLPEAAALAGASLRAFGMDSSETERAVAVMTLGANKSALSFDYLNTAMSIVSPVAKTFGFSIEDTTALLGSLADSGFDASSAATATRNILLNLADSNGKLARSLGQPVNSLEDLVDGLNTLKDRGVNLATTLELTDKRSVAAFNTFLRGADHVKALRTELGDTDGVLKRIQEERLNTLEGSVKLLGSAWESLVLSFSGAKEPVRDVVDGLTGIINAVVDMRKEATVAYGEQMEKVVGLTTDLEPLVSEYDTLKQKTSLSADEHSRLNTLLGKIAETVPGAITQWDEYGQAVEISTEKVREYMAAEKARLQFVNKEAIKELQEKIEGLKSAMKVANAKHDATWEAYDSPLGNVSGIREFSYDEIQQRKAKYAVEMKKIGKDLKGAEEELKRISGETVEKQVNDQAEAINQRRAFNAMTKEQLAEWIAETQKAKKEHDATSEVMYNNELLNEFNVNHRKSLQEWISDEKAAQAKYLEIARQIYDKKFADTGGGQGDGKPDKEMQRYERTKNRYKESELKAEEKLASEELKLEAEKNKAVVEDTKAGYEARAEALKKYEEALIGSIEKQKEAQFNALVRKAQTDLKDPKTGKELSEVEARKEVANEIVLIEAKASGEINKIKQDSAAMQVEIERKRVDDVIKNIAREASARGQEISGKESTEQSYLAKDYASGLMSEEVYQAKKAKIAKDYAIERFNAEADALQQQIDLAPEEEKLKLEQQLGQKRLDYQKWVAEQEIASAEALGEKKKELLQETFEFANQLVEQQFEAKLEKLEQESEENEAWAEEEKERIERLEESGAISKEQAEARKALVDDQARAREEEIEKKKKEVLKKQAIYEKAKAVMQVALSTAMSIASSAQMGFPAAIPFIAMAAALGAVQTAMVLATPIPEYARGTQDHPGGLALVGDGGRSELVIANGMFYKTPSTDTLVDLPKHSVVLPDFRVAMSGLPTLPIVPEKDNMAVDFSELSGLMKDSNDKLGKIVVSIKKSKKNGAYGAGLFNANKIGI